MEIARIAKKIINRCTHRPICRAILEDGFSNTSDSTSEAWCIPVHRAVFLNLKPQIRHPEESSSVTVKIDYDRLELIRELPIGATDPRRSCP